MNNDNNTFNGPLPHLSILRFIGKDAASFLQGQLTIDTVAMLNNQWRRGAYCTRQGRVLCNGILLRFSHQETDCFLFLMASDLVCEMADTLRRYVLRAKVKIDVPSVICTAKPLALEAPQLCGELNVDEGKNTITWIDGSHWHLQFLSAEDTDSEKNLEPNMDWKAYEISRGVAWVGKSSSEKLLPHFINLEVLGGVDFDKGCFLGQEVIARLHNMGEVKRRGFIITGIGNCPSEGTSIMSGEKTVGEIINAASTQTGFIAISSLQCSVQDQALTVNGDLVKVIPLPYVIPDKKKFRAK